MGTERAKNTILILAPLGSDLVEEGRSLEGRGCAMELRSKLPEGAENVPKGAFDLVCVDLAAPREAAIETVRRLRAVDADLPIIAVGDREQQSWVEELVSAGVYDVLFRPLATGRIAGEVDMLLLRKGMLVRPVSLEGGLREEPGFRKIVGSSARIRDVFRSIETATSSNVPVLILGETGTGKELVARAIHYRGPRRRSPFFSVNCAATPEMTIESELFGHERGAFNGAIDQRRGKLEDANGGTLFLDEIIEMPSTTQLKLVQFMEQQSFERLGGGEKIRSDVRLVAATNADVQEAVRQGRLREELFYRIGVFPIPLPALRARKNDIADLAQYFLERAASEMNRPVSGLSTEALRALEEYDWPGNVRELQNAMRRAVLFAQGKQIEPSHLGLDQKVAGIAAATIEDELDQIFKNMREGRIVQLEVVEEAMICLALNATAGNVSEAADKLGISRSTIYRKLHAIQRKRARRAKMKAEKATA